MNHRILGILSFGLTLLSSGTAADYFANFDGAPFQANYSASQFIDLGDGTYLNVDTNAVTTSPNDWVTTDANQGDSVVQISGYRVYLGDLWVIMGGLVNRLPSSTHTELWEPLNEGNFTFIVKFSITASDSVRPANDTFAWTFRNTAGGVLFAIRFDPKTTGTNPDPVRKLDINWVDSNSNVHIPNDAFGNSTIFRNAIYTLRVDANFQLGTFAARVTEPINNTQSVFTGILPVGENLGGVAATWQLESNFVTNFGSNSMIFDNYTVSTPGSVILPPVKIARQVGGAIALSWNYPPTLAPGVVFALESRTGLATLPTWTPLVATITKPTLNPGIFQALLPSDPAPARFYRLRVTSP